MLLFWRRAPIARAQSTLPGGAGRPTRPTSAPCAASTGWPCEVTAVTQRGSLPLYLGTILLVVVVLPGGALLMLARRGRTTCGPGTPRPRLLVGAIMVVAAVLAATSRGRLRR